MSFLDDFLVRAVIAGIGVAMAAGPLGCFVVWRRMAYFGDATSHAALLGVVLALAVEMPILPGVAIAAVAMALTVSLASGERYGADTMLGVAAHAALALGLVALSLMPNVRVDLSGYLFGDILSVSRADLVTIWGGAAIIVGILLWRWSRLLLATLNEDLAVSTGVNTHFEKIVLTVALALLVAVALQVVGALLITAMLIIPAAAARAVTGSPEAMARLAVLVGVLSVLAGLEASYHLDTPTGPSIVTASVVALVLTSMIGAIRGRKA